MTTTRHDATPTGGHPDTAASRNFFPDVLRDPAPTARPDHATVPTPGQHPTTLTRRRRSRLFAPAAGLAVVAVLGLTLFWLNGGRWFSVATPSMGTTAPVGTLIATRPVDVADLHVGDVVAFVPPTERTVTYTHRIVGIDHAGTGAATFSTRGDINGAADPWTLTQHDLVGRAVVIAPGVGYLLRAAPLWLIGSLVTWTLSRFWIPGGWRTTVQMIAGAVLYLVAALTIRPFLGIVQLVTTTDTDGTAHISAVSTGLLPVRLAAVKGHGVAAPVDLTYGQTGVINLHPEPGATSGSYDVSAHLHLPWWGWIAIIAVWSLPTVASLVVGRRRARQTPLEDRHPDEPDLDQEPWERLLRPEEVLA